jgi:hypothetical protein
MPTSHVSPPSNLMLTVGISAFPAKLQGFYENTIEDSKR